MLYILSMGYSHPDTTINNRFMEDLEVGTNEEWILDKIGIEERATSLPLEYIQKTRNQNPKEARAIATVDETDLAVKACEMALERAGLKPSEIGLVITNTCTPSHVAPAESVRITERLGISPKAYDIFTACPAFSLH